MESIEGLLDRYAELAGERARRLRKYAEDPTVELGDDDFEYFVRSHRLVVVVFEAEWCSPCKVYKPIFLEVARKYSGRGVVFARVDSDKASKTADNYHVDYIPTTLVFVDGKPVDVLVGAMEKNTLETLVLKYVSPS